MIFCIGLILIIISMAVEHFQQPDPEDSIFWIHMVVWPMLIGVPLVTISILNFAWYNML